MSFTLIQMMSWFFLALGFGTYLFAPLVSTKLTGVGFFKLLLSVSAGSLVISLIANILMGNATLSSQFYFLIFVLVLLVFQYFVHRDEKSIFMWGLYLVSVLFMLLTSYFRYGASLSELSLFLLSTLFMGVTNFIMVLGHYYLVVPKLTERPLLIGHYILWPLLLMKLTWSLYTAFEHQSFYASGTYLGDGYIFNMIVLLMRLFWGYLALGILSIFSYKLSRMRSIQSATGVFYVMVFFMIVGELIASYALFHNGLKL